MLVPASLSSIPCSLCCAAYRCGAVAVSCISGIRYLYMGGTYSYYGGSGWISTVADYGNHMHAQLPTHLEVIPT